MDVLIATRTYRMDDLRTGREHTARDFMYRKPCGSFVLKETSDMPGERGDEVAYSLDGVFAWLRDMPWQVERMVVTPSSRNAKLKAFCEKIAVI